MTEEPEKSMVTIRLIKNRTYLLCFRFPGNELRSPVFPSRSFLKYAGFRCISWKTLRDWLSLPASACNKVVFPQPGGPSNRVILMKKSGQGLSMNYFAFCFYRQILESYFYCWQFQIHSINSITCRFPSTIIHTKNQW
ncbi:hypothetical protein LWI29_027935 [Acer saccharum]|uniref:Uncharacterized protein n=1 Tax=Acer saccharum TaxID=4024 RepID=A0AA39VUF8_ACESA|nr:hypothetical protein LWI29_027935 [Acer saccharum]